MQGFVYLPYIQGTLTNAPSHFPYPRLIALLRQAESSKMMEGYCAYGKLQACC